MRLEQNLGEKGIVYISTKNDGTVKAGKDRMGRGCVGTSRQMRNKARSDRGSLKTLDGLGLRQTEGA